jgi:hypothetical protein
MGTPKGELRQASIDVPAQRRGRPEFERAFERSTGAIGAMQEIHFETPQDHRGERRSGISSVLADQPFEKGSRLARVIRKPSYVCEEHQFLGLGLRGLHRDPLFAQRFVRLAMAPRRSEGFPTRGLCSDDGRCDGYRGGLFSKHFALRFTWSRCRG